MVRKPKDFRRLSLQFRSVAGKKCLSFAFMMMSDIHLGWALSRANETQMFLGQATADHINFGGDIIEGEGLMLAEQNSLPDPDHVATGSAIFAKAKETKVTFTPGNHDILLSQFSGQSLNGMAIENELKIVDSQGRRIHVSHGHEFDAELQGGAHQGFWHSFGDRFIQGLQRMDRKLNALPPKILRLAGMDRDYSLAHELKQGFGYNFIRDRLILKRMKAHHAILEALDNSNDDIRFGGHTHMGGFYRTPSGKLVANSGSCTDNVQAQVIDHTGFAGHITAFHRGVKVTTQENHSYMLTWKELGLPGFYPSRLTSAAGRSFVKETELLVALACDGENGKKTTPSQVSLDSHTPV